MLRHKDKPLLRIAFRYGVACARVARAIHSDLRCSDDYARACVFRSGWAAKLAITHDHGYRHGLMKLQVGTPWPRAGGR